MAPPTMIAPTLDTSLCELSHIVTPSAPTPPALSSQPCPAAPTSRMSRAKMGMSTT